MDEGSKVDDKQLWLTAEAIVVGKFGIHAVYKALQMVRAAAIATQAGATMDVGLKALMQRHHDELEAEMAAHRDALALCAEYEATIARQAARITELEAGIRAMYQIDQSQESRMDINAPRTFYARGHNDGVDFARTKQAKALELRQEELVAELDRLRAELADTEMQLARADLIIMSYRDGRGE